MTIREDRILEQPNTKRSSAARIILRSHAFAPPLTVCSYAHRPFTSSENHKQRHDRKISDKAIPQRQSMANNPRCPRLTHASALQTAHPAAAKLTACLHAVAASAHPAVPRAALNQPPRNPSPTSFTITSHTPTITGTSPTSTGTGNPPKPLSLSPPLTLTHNHPSGNSHDPTLH